MIKEKLLWESTDFYSIIHEFAKQNIIFFYMYECWIKDDDKTKKSTYCRR